MGLKCICCWLHEQSGIRNLVFTKIHSVFIQDEKFNFQIIGGNAVKRYGGKRMLTLAVCMWSLSTFITPWFASSINALIFLRVLLGLGEGIGLLVLSSSL